MTGEDFATTAAHELQEPLRKIAAFARLLTEEKSHRLDEEGRRYTAFLEDAATRLQVLVGDILDHALYATPCDGGPVNLDRVVAQVRTDLAEELTACGATVEVGALPSVWGEAEPLRTLFRNLLGNAVKYREPDRAPLIRVEAEAAGDQVTVTVADNGIGFAADQAETIMEPFRRLHGRAIPGTGLGLAICRRVAHALGGSLTASGTPGVGAEFRVVLKAVE